MKAYLVTAVRNNRVEMVVTITKVKEKAQEAFINTVYTMKGKEEANLLLKDFSDGILDDEGIVRITPELNIHITTFDLIYNN
jgi:isochorismate hydrolase